MRLAQRCESALGLAERRRAALRKATAIRSARARLKKDLAAGSVGIAEVLERPPECAGTERLAELLLAVPKYGRVRVARLLRRIRISDTTTLARLSDRQRSELITHFRR
jgi:S13-like H2TH domain